MWSAWGDDRGWVSWRRRFAGVASGGREPKYRLEGAPSPGEFSVNDHGARRRLGASESVELSVRSKGYREGDVNCHHRGMVRVERVERLRELLMASDRTTVIELAASMGVSVRTMRRDLAYLRERGLDIEGEAGSGGGIRLRRDRGVTAVHMTFDEIIALWTAASLMRRASALPWSGAAKSALEKLLASVPSQRAKELRGLLRRVMIGPPASDRVAQSARASDTELLPCVEDALRRRYAISFDYEDREGRRSRRITEPHGLLIQPPVWYILAFDVEKSEPRMFRMDRISRVAALKKHVFDSKPTVIEALTREIASEVRGLS